MEKKLMSNIEKVIVTYIPKNNRCRIDEAKNEFKRGKEKVEILQAINEKVDMSNPLQMEIKTDWVQQPPNMSICRACKETIYSIQYTLKITVDGEILQINNKTLCEPCYNFNNG